MATKKTTTKPKAATKTTAKKPATRSAAPKKTTKKKTTAATKKATTSRPKKVEKVPIMTKSFFPMTFAEQLCQNVNPDLKAQAISLANAVLTMQEKIEQQIPIYKDEPLAQMVTLGSGETTLRPNPIVQEFRATVRDYATALENLEKILDTKTGTKGTSSVEDLRSRFKVG